MLSKGTSKLIIQTEPPIPTVAAASSSPPPWIELPDDLTANILQRLDAEEILGSAQLVCRTWWRICKNPAMWRVIDLGRGRCSLIILELICRCAVNRSQGQLVDLKLSGSRYQLDGLLSYATERSSQLRCLTLDVFSIIENVFTLTLTNLTQLEELHLMTTPMLDPIYIETISISCPVLKSFAYSNVWDDQLQFTEHAIAIGKNMPNLRHLRLFSLGIENKGLEAILDGCPNLESLHLQQCSGLDLQGDLGKRCSDQIKDLILDSESSQSEGDQANYD